MIKDERQVILTQQEFDDLLEYNFSEPTGLTIGKHWKHHDFCNRYGFGTGWHVAWVSEDPEKKPNIVVVHYRKALIVKLVKEICQKCYGTDNWRPWHEEDETMWKGGWIRCPHQTIMINSKYVSTKDSPHSTCPYALEHILHAAEPPKLEIPLWFANTNKGNKAIIS